jgi:hypothetical protein
MTGQCTKILESGEQCSNRAVPGTRYCEQHRRAIQFKPVPRVPPAPEPTEAAPEKAPPPPDWRAQARAAGAPPALAGLRADARNILVGPAARIWLAAEADPPAPLFPRLVRLLAALSQALPLPGGVAVQTVPGGGGALVSLHPPDPGAEELSRLYDAAADAAALSGGLLYVGDGRAFVQYRDGGAPRGYDVADVRLPPGDALYLIDRQGTHPLPPDALTPVPLDDLLLRIAPRPERGAERPEVVYALIAPALYRMLARYFRDHHLHYRVARLHAPPGDTLMLYEIAPRPDAPTGALVPAFVLSYLEALPRCRVLTQVWAGEGRRMLVTWRQRYPCRPRHVVGAFPEGSLLLLGAGPDFDNLCVTPSPTFFEGDALTAAHAPHPRRADLVPLNDGETLLSELVELPVHLVPDTGRTPATAALVLENKELAWVRRLLYRLPGEAFGAYRLCVGRERSVLVGEGVPVEALPFGVPLRRVQDTQLFIPLQARFAPDLPWALLAEALGLQEDVYTFFTPRVRLDVPRRAFAPLSRALVADPDRPRVRLQVQPAPTLPELHWTAPPPVEEKEPEGWLGRLWGQREEPAPPPTQATPPGPAPGAQPQDVAGWLQARAREHQEEGDLLSAALLFALAGDAAEAGRCYRHSVRARRDGARPAERTADER